MKSHCALLSPTIRSLQCALALAVGLFFASTVSAEDVNHPNEAQERKGVTMQLQSAYPVIVTSRLDECREFYTKNFGFDVVFEASWFIYMASAANPGYGIAFMTPDHPSRPPGPEAFSGKGMFLTLQVADAASEHERLKNAGVAIAYPLAVEPWGQRRFGVLDPSGMWVDVVEQIEPAPGFWDKYTRPK